MNRLYLILALAASYYSEVDCFRGSSIFRTCQGFSRLRLSLIGHVPELERAAACHVGVVPPQLTETQLAEIMLAIMNNNLEGIEEYTASYGVNVMHNTSNFDHRYSLLTTAIIGNRDALVKKVLNAGIFVDYIKLVRHANGPHAESLDAFCYEKTTNPLFVAIKHSRMDVVEKLVSLGADCGFLGPRFYDSSKDVKLVTEAFDTSEYYDSVYQKNPSEENRIRRSDALSIYALVRESARVQLMNKNFKIYQLRV